MQGMVKAWQLSSSSGHCLPHKAVSLVPGAGPQMDKAIGWVLGPVHPGLKSHNPRGLREHADSAALGGTYQLSPKMPTLTWPGLNLTVSLACKVSSRLHHPQLKQHCRSACVQQLYHALMIRCSAGSASIVSVI